MAKPAPNGADRRPRIHVWLRSETAEFSFGPCGDRCQQPTVGRAVELALATINHAPAVIIFEGMSADALLAQHMKGSACG
jgi:hypothetical protein